MSNGLVPVTPDFTSGVIEEVKRRGFDPGKVHSCMPSSDLQSLGGRQGVMGCNMWNRCPFGLTRNGGFKGHTWRPKHVLYYLEPNDGTTHMKEDLMSCRNYVQQLMNRGKDGARDMENGRAGEIIQIIGHEPCEAEKLRIAADKNYRPEHYDDPCPDCGLRHWYMENVLAKDPKSLNPLLPDWKNRQTIKLCVEYQHPSQMAGEQHERDMREKARKRMGDDPALKQGPPRKLVENPHADWEDSQRKGDDDALPPGDA